MLDTTTGEVVKTTLKHEGKSVREFYSNLPRPVRVGIEATGSMQWFVNLMEELEIECLVGHPAEIRASEPRKQKHDRRDFGIVSHADKNCASSSVRERDYSLHKFGGFSLVIQTDKILKLDGVRFTMTNHVHYRL